MVKDLRGMWYRRREQRAAHLTRACFGLLVGGASEGVIIGVPRTQPCGALGDGVLLPPRLHISVGAIARGIVGGGVRLEAIGEALDQIWPLATARPVGGGANDGVDAEHVGAIHAHARETVTSGAIGDAPGDLLAHRYGDSPLIRS